MTASGLRAASSFVMAEDVKSLDQDGGRPYISAQYQVYRGRKYRETTRDRIKADMDLMNEIGRLRYTHQWTSRVDILHPPVNLLVRPKSEI